MKPGYFDNYDESVLISFREETFDNYIPKKDDFSKYFNQKLNELNTNFEIPLTKKEIAEKLGLSYELFRKIINREKPAKKRDCIIAVCAMLGLDTDDTNLALKFNDNMPKLDDRNGRDETIMTILDDHRRHYRNDENEEQDDLDYNPDIINEINKELAENDYPLLDIISHRKRTASSEKKSPKSQNLEYPHELKYLYSYAYTGIRFGDELWSSRIVLNSNEPDLNNETWTHYNNTAVSAIMGIEYNGKETEFKIRVTGNYKNKNENYYCTDETGKRKYKNIADTGVFKEFFSELRKMAYEELRKSDNIYNDTKNFIRRVAASVIDGDLHVFTETFNFDNPVLNEYYLLDYCNGEYKMTVSNKSRFMKMFLPRKIYKEKYGNTRNKILTEYDPVKNTFSVSFCNNTSLENANACRVHYFQILKNELDSFILTIREKNSINEIERTEAISDNRTDIEYSVISFYKAENEFQCVFKPDIRMICAYLDLQDNINNAPDIKSPDDLNNMANIIRNTTIAFNRYLKSIDTKESVHKGDNLQDISVKIQNYLDTTNDMPDFEQDFIITCAQLKKALDRGFFNKSQVNLAYLKSLIKSGQTLRSIFDDEYSNEYLVEELSYIYHKNKNEYMIKANTPLNELIDDEALYDEICNKEFLNTVKQVGNPRPEFSLSDGRKVELSASDLYDGYFLNMHTIEEIGQTLLKHGSLKIDDLL